MNYSEVINWLFSQLANYQKQGGIAYKPGLDNIKALLTKIGNPQKQFKSIHIAGTNGKGSTAHILASIAIENGYKVGLFTSPHIKDFRERIKINGVEVSESFVVDFVTRNKAFFEELNPSFFEITTAMAFAAFAEEECDITIIETGLGGRLDSTNVIQPEISVITNIGLDHTEMLGDTLAKIAKEKAGIIKPKTPVIIGEILPETEPIFMSVAQYNDSALYQSTLNHYTSDLLGDFQQNNLSLAWDTMQILKDKGLYFDDVKSINALKRIKKNTGLRGRLELIQKSPNIILDASHNSDGIERLFQEIGTMKYDKLHCIYGTSNDKAYLQNGKWFPKRAKYYFTSFDSPRSATEDGLNKFGNHHQLDYKYFDSPELALKSAKIEANPNDLILVFGSFFILEKII